MADNPEASASKDQQDSQSATPATRPKSLRPRVGVQRRTQAERDEYAKQEADRLKARSAQTKTVAKSARGGRGGTVGGNGRDDRSRGVASALGGVFGAGVTTSHSRNKNLDIGTSEVVGGRSVGADTGGDGMSSVIDTGDSKGGTARGGRGGRGSGGGGGGASSKQVVEGVDYVDSDYEQGGRPTRDIERIWISSDEDEDVVPSGRRDQRAATAKPPKMSVGLRPVRAARSLLEEAADDDVEKTRKTPRGVRPVDDSAIVDVDNDSVKDDGVDVVQTDSSSVVKKDPLSSPELPKRSIRRLSSKNKDPKIASETVEERSERLRLYEDIKKLRGAFLPSSELKKARSNSEMKDIKSALSPGSSEDGRLFLFQFPPSIPRLVDPSAADVADEVKAENGDTIAPGPLEGTTVKAEPSTGTEGGATEKAKQARVPPSVTLTADSHSERLSPGLAGKLRIHRSGRVTLDWGGTSMEVRYGTEAGFLQDAVLVETPQSHQSAEGEERTEKKTGQAFALGQVQQKMVMIPDWSRLYA